MDIAFTLVYQALSEKGWKFLEDSIVIINKCRQRNKFLLKNVKDMN